MKKSNIKRITGEREVKRKRNTEGKRVKERENYTDSDKRKKKEGETESNIFIYTHGKNIYKRKIQFQTQLVIPPCVTSARQCYCQVSNRAYIKPMHQS